MINVSRVGKNLIGVSLLSSILVFWLGSRYLSDALTQFSGAQQLQSSVAPESTLFEVADNLDHERATIQQILISSTRFGNDRDNLRAITKNSRSLFDTAKQQILLSRSSGSQKNQKRYSDESVELLISDLEDRFKRLSIASSILIAQTYLPFPKRDESVRLQMFDAYVNLIAAVNTLRKRIHALPEKKYIKVLSAHDTKNSIWTVSDSINQTSTLIESFLLKYKLSALESLNVENLALRVFQQHERASESLADLTEMVDDQIINGAAASAVSELNTHYDNTFRAQAKSLILTSPTKSDANELLENWARVTSTTKEKVRALKVAALSNTLTTADTIKSNATVTLLSNAFLVLLCVAMAYATFRIGKKIQHQADHDDLTGIPNRRYFCAKLETLFKQTDTTKNESLVLMTLDLNGFKAINDTMGHVAGDNLLIMVSDRLTSLVGAHMTLARMGGDEFAIAFITSDPEAPYQLACQIRDTFETSFKLDDGLVKIDTSIGYSKYPSDSDTVKQLQITSDFAMFNAKQSGRKTIQPYDQKIADQFENRVAIEKDLVHAIDNDELELYYQPQFNLVLNKVNAVEALIRWNHPTRGMVSPAEFIAVAEETGLMPAIGTWVLNEACKQAAIWNNTGDLPIRVAVNVSVHQIMQAEFVQEVINVIEHHNISASCLELEITESVVMADINWIARCLNTLKDYGLRIALDDFGTGYSSLNQLQELPLDTLKIDRSFISGLDDKRKNMRSVTATITSIAEIYGLETVAEGIESDEQLVEVNKLGIDVAQGYYYSKPVARDEVTDAVASINRLTERSVKAA